jgi:PilZ domain-containing protein
MPATVSGYRQETEWQEEVRTVDISVGDIAVTLSRPVDLGDILLVELPFPVRIKGEGLEVKSVLSIVRRVAADEEGQQIVGLEFLETPDRSASVN